MDIYFITSIALNIVCFLLLIASIIKFNKEKLHSESLHRIELETALRRLALGSNTQNIDAFYREMLRALYDLSEADFILIGIPNDETQQVNTLCAVVNGEIAENFSYNLKGSPCEVVVNSTVCIYKANVAELFPHDQMLSDEKIESYIGLPLLDSNDRPIGIIALLSRRPFLEEPRFMDTLKVFASRTSAEIRRDKTEQTLKAMAYHDYLSKLPNRAAMLEEINHSYESCQKKQENALLMLLDIDNFEHINRKYGNDVGDQVIQQIGQRFMLYATESMFIARNSGDNFAILLKKADSETMSLVSVHWAAIRSIISEPCIIGRRQISVACSMGAVSFPEQIDNRFDVISSAEQALREAKLRGRDQFFVFDPQMLATRDLQRDIETDLIKAVQENDQLYVVFQPKVTEFGTVVGAETLLRWEHPTRGNIPPSDFIPIAEKSGLIHEIGKWLVVEVCAQMQRWQQQGNILYPISINASSSQFDNPLFVEFLLLTISEYGLANPLIEIELTESGVLADTANAIENIQILRNAGISVSLDDFGTGYSSLSYLHILPINVLKIDKSFIDNIHESQSAELVRSILALSETMHLKTIAEGTETKAQVDILSKMGCHYFQGYHFSKPLLPDDYLAFCDKANGF